MVAALGHACSLHNKHGIFKCKQIQLFSLFSPEVTSVAKEMLTCGFSMWIDVILNVYKIW